MAVQPHPDSLLGCLAALPDPRRRQGRRYPLPAILGLVLMGMLHGRDSLRGGWVWARQHWSLLWRPLGGRSPHFPSYNTVRTLLLSLDADDVDRRLQPWLSRLLDHPLGGISADGKVLRGSKRDQLPALHVVSLVAHDCASILAQRQAVDGDEVGALLVLLAEVPLTQRTISMDAGLLSGAVTQTITEPSAWMPACSVVPSLRRSRSRRASISGWSRATIPRCWQCWTSGSRQTFFPPSAEMAAPLPVPEAQIAPPRKKRQRDGARPELRPRRAADAQTVEKSRGRLEMGELWVVDADDLGAYLAAEWGWHNVEQIAWVRRWRRRRPSELWTVEQVTVVTSRTSAKSKAAHLLGLVRGHWTIENRVHWVRDMSFHEDRLHGRAIGGMLSWLRNIAINLIRHVWAMSFIPDAWSRLSVDPRIALRWLHFPLMN